MNVGIDVLFFEPDAKEKQSGRLFFNENGKDYLEFQGTLKDLFQTIKVVYAEAIDSEERFTLVNCVFRFLGSGVCRFTINELYKGDFLGKISDNDCLEVKACITGLTRWINRPRIHQKFSFSINEESNITLKEIFQIRYPIGETITIELILRRGI
jgi:hypothetical protein